MNSRYGWLVLLGSLAACQATPDQDRYFDEDLDRASGWEQTSSYLKDVGYDFMDIFTLSVDGGKAGPLLVHGDVRATKFLATGWGNWSGYSAGILGRGVGVWREERTESGISVGPLLNHSFEGSRIPYRGNGALGHKYLDAFGYDINLDERFHWADLGGSLHLIGVGVTANLSPYELLDFVYGLVGNYPNPARLTTTEMPWDYGIDIADDDTRVSRYDAVDGRFRHNDYSIWPTIWPTTFTHEQVEGEEWEQEPYRGPETGSFGGMYGER